MIVVDAAPLHLDTQRARGTYAHSYQLIARDGGAYVGHIAFTVLEGHHHCAVYIDLIEVAEGRRAQGIATKLMDRLLQWASREFSDPVLHVGLLTDDGTRFFRRYFERRPELRGGRFRGSRRAVGLTW
jgi:GNAT superfamily N-acetyltransferase